VSFQQVTSPLQDSLRIMRHGAMLNQLNRGKTSSRIQGECGYSEDRWE
jgi:hypothetical protein